MIYLFLAWSWITFTFLLTMCYWAYCWRVWKQVEVLYLNAITNFTSWSNQLHKNMFSLKAPLWFMFMMILIRQNSWWKTTLVREHPSFQIMILKIALKKFLCKPLAKVHTYVWYYYSGLRRAVPLYSLTSGDLGHISRSQWQ